MHTTDAYLTVFHALKINAHLQSRLDTYFNKDAHRTVLYFLVYDQDKEKQKEIKNVMSFRGKIVCTGQLYKPLAEKHKCVNIPIDFKWEHRRILQIVVDADFVNSSLFIFARAKHVILTVQGQRMWNVAFVTIREVEKINL